MLGKKNLEEGISHSALISHFPWMGDEWIAPASSFLNGFTGLLCAFFSNNTTISDNYYGGCFRWTSGCGGTGKLSHASLVSAFSQFSTMDSAQPLSHCVFPQQLFWNQTLYDYMYKKKILLCVWLTSLLKIMWFNSQFAKKNPLYLSSWIISILILIPPQHWLLHPPPRPSVSLSVSGSDVTPNYSDSSPSNITMSLWCSCRGTGNQEPECDAFHRDFTHNTCLSESSVCLIPQYLWWPNLVTKPWRWKERRQSVQGVTMSVLS